MRRGERVRQGLREVSIVSYHVEVGADFDSPGQVPHDGVPVMAGREQDSGIERMRLQHKHLVLVSL